MRLKERNAGCGGGRDCFFLRLKGNCLWANVHFVQGRLVQRENVSAGWGRLLFLWRMETVISAASRSAKSVPPPICTPPRKRKLIAFGWYGGKFSHLEWLLPLLPPCHHYCEPFAGSAAVLLNREPCPVETYNDMDGEVVNFFRVLARQQGSACRSDWSNAVLA